MKYIDYIENYSNYTETEVFESWLFNLLHLKKNRIAVLAFIANQIINHDNFKEFMDCLPPSQLNDEFHGSHGHMLRIDDEI